MKTIIKCILLLSLIPSAYALQTTVEIIQYCEKTYLKEYGNWMVLECVKQELEALKEIEAISK